MLPNIPGFEQSIRQRIIAYCDQGKEKILKSGVSVDEILEAEITNPAGDQRYGVNLIARPPQEIKQYIISIQNYLREQGGERDQYYYPPDEFHATIVEICSSKTSLEVYEISKRVLENLNDILHDAPAAEIHSPIPVFDNRACSINLLPIDHDLEKMRRSISEKLNANGIHVAPRYHDQAAHVTFMRYIKPLNIDNREWLDIITHCPEGDSLRWNINELWLTWGLTWYGRRSLIKESGPHVLSIPHSHR